MPIYEIDGLRPVVVPGTPQLEVWPGLRMHDRSEHGFLTVFGPDAEPIDDPEGLPRALRPVARDLAAT